MTKKVEGIGGQRTSAAEGIGIGAGLIASAIISLWVPGYLEATHGWRTFWFIVGAVLGLTGAGGIGFEMSRLTGVEGFDDIGAGLVVAGVGGILHVIQATLAAGAVRSLLQVALVLFLLTAPIGIMRGVARIALARPPSDGVSVAARLLSLATALLGLSAAALNFLRAAQ